MSCVYLVVPVTYGSSLPTGCESASSRDEVRVMCAPFYIAFFCGEVVSLYSLHKKRVHMSMCVKTQERDTECAEIIERFFSARRYAMSLTTARARETESTESREISAHSAHTHPPSMQPDSLSHTHTRARARAIHTPNAEGRSRGSVPCASLSGTR